MKHKIDIPRPLSIILDKLIIALRPLLLRITSEHTLQAHTHALYVMNRGPSRAVEQVETDDAVGVDVWVPGNGVGLCFDEDDFGGLDLC
jgi:hypothetical protein